jgi:hypothetical protein
MSDKEYELLGIETIIDETGGTEESTAQVLEMVNGKPTALYIVPTFGRFAPPKERTE